MDEPALYYAVMFGLIFLRLGVGGFRKRGIEFSETKRIQGQAGVIVGSVCIAIGVGIIFAAIWFATPAGQNKLATLLFGVAIGVYGTWTLLRDRPIVD